MDNTAYVGLTQQMALRRRLDIIANNVANADTAGFKVEQLLTSENPVRPAVTHGLRDPADFVRAGEVARDFAQGGFTRTGNPLDVAIEGDAFLTVRTPQGDRYTRDGRLQLDGQGRLVTASGEPVLGDGGEIVIPPEGEGPLAIAVDGSITRGGQPIGQISLVRFDDRRQLRKEGDNLFASDQPGRAAPDARLRSGMIEQSNVQPVLEITSLIEVSRAYERVTRMVDSTEDLSRRAVERLGKAQ